MNVDCKQCNVVFEVTDVDLAFYRRISPCFGDKTYEIPAPTLCPDCRQQRRLSFRNERNLYHRESDLSKEKMITMYAPDAPYKVYDQAEWWGDKWDPLEYGKDFDFNRPFFEQFKELMMAVPRISLINKEHDNSEYCNFAIQNKNSYLLFTCAECEECLYCNRTWTSTNVCDSSNVLKCELCYEAMDSDNCYNCRYIKNCSNCSDLTLCQNMRGCQNCFGCFGLVSKKYCIGNVQYSKEEYEKKVIPFVDDLAKSKENFLHWVKSMPRKYAEVTNIENSTGDALTNCKNSQFCFEAKNLEDCKFIFNATFLKDCYDVNNDDHSELVYECIGSEKNYAHAFNDICWYDSETYYSSLCFNSKHLFGCSGLKKNEYCILNKQYTKEQYEELVPKIIEHMQKTDEWGEFFPMSISPFAYNESMARDYYPLDKMQVEGMGLKWRETLGEKPQGDKAGHVPDSVENAGEDVTKQIFSCEVTGHPYKIVPAEIHFYKKMRLGLPKKCPDQRHLERMVMRNPRKLWERKCDKCGIAVSTSYSSERPEKIYCEKCYLEAVY